jgi:hypothetical protein
MWWRKLDRRQKLRRWAVSLWTTPLIMLFPMWLGLFADPSLILEYASVYVLFFGLPFATAAILYWIAAQVPKSDSRQ